MFERYLCRVERIDERRSCSATVGFAAAIEFAAVDGIDDFRLVNLAELASEGIRVVKIHFGGPQADSHNLPLVVD